MDNEEIEQWLKELNKDRKWLAEKLGISKGTLDNQFSRGFSVRALKQIELLKNPPASKSDLELVFSDEQFDVILNAVRIAGYGNRRDFYKDAILEKAESYSEDETSATESEVSRRKAG